MPRMALTAPQRRILGECIAAGRHGAHVWGRNMTAVDRLKNMGLITVTWTLDGVYSRVSRWHGVALATPAGRRAYVGLIAWLMYRTSC